MSKNGGDSLHGDVRIGGPSLSRMEMGTIVHLRLGPAMTSSVHTLHPTMLNRAFADTKVLAMFQSALRDSRTRPCAGVDGSSPHLRYGRETETAKARRDR